MFQHIGENRNAVQRVHNGDTTHIKIETIESFTVIQYEIWKNVLKNELIGFFHISLQYLGQGIDDPKYL